MQSALKSGRTRIRMPVGLGSLTLLAHKVVQLWDEFAHYSWKGDYAWPALSMLIFEGYSAVLAFACQLNLKVSGASLGRMAGAVAYFHSNLLCYLPGAF